MAIVEYDGTAYEGFQIQQGRPTIQAALERAIARITQERVRVVGAGRTDSGVHAEGQVIHFDSAWDRPLDVLQRALNAVLPEDIAIRHLGIAPDGFHARYSALNRCYRYTIVNRPVRAPLLTRYAHHVSHPLDVETMHQAGQVLIGEHDFRAFGSPMQPGGTTVRRIESLSCERRGDLVTITVVGNAFLRRMVRRIAGTLVEVGLGRLVPADVANLLAARDPNEVKWTLPPHGLCLVKVNYAVDWLRS